MYVVRFDSESDIDTERVQAQRKVFHVPKRSTFLHTWQLRSKGCDASNIENDFSDDEQESRHRRMLKKPNRTRNGKGDNFPLQKSLFPGDPTPEEQEIYYGDADEGTLYPPLSTPQRPVPSAYEEFSPGDQPNGLIDPGDVSQQDSYMRRVGYGRSHHAGHSRPGDSSPGHINNYDPRNPVTGRPMSPTSLAIAKATGQWNDLPIGQNVPEFGNHSPWIAFDNMALPLRTLSLGTATPQPTQPYQQQRTPFGAAYDPKYPGASHAQS
ncbi:uncharacterized protein EI90DRAFT_3046194 [Cantharellus anzutake]|uniref:uncharacterized protein n=1 Tax=Cantharellus anzutake TaxID=1750568 RepID=UPI0019065087|nr:uncharacterized protein EI90DRAFT_3046194 [Cantharellus anzutake]KAF8336562.1 hypothetical protein EI90DRAFT_3046194 [Cantharellus anzutake]